MATRELKIQIIGDASSAQRAFRTVDNDAETLRGKLNRKFGTAGKLAFGGLVAGAAAFSVESVRAYAEAETAQSKLEGAFKKFPQLAGKNAKVLQQYNSQLARKTKFDDDATASGQAVLAGFGLTEGQLMAITPLLQDYASRTGKDLPAAATDLGRALNGQGRALKAIGIDFKTTGDQAADFTRLAGDLEGKVGGFAAREGRTAAGKLEILRNQYGELQEAVGERLMPALLTFSDWLTETAFPALETMGRGFTIVKTKLGEFWGSIKENGAQIAGAFGWWGDKVATLVGWLKKAERYVDNLIGKIPKIDVPGFGSLMDLGGGKEGAQEAADKLTGRHTPSTPTTTPEAKPKVTTPTKDAFGFVINHNYYGNADPSEMGRRTLWDLGRVN